MASAGSSSSAWRPSCWCSPPAATPTSPRAPPRQLVPLSRARRRPRPGVGSFGVRSLIAPDQNLYHCPANTVTLTGRGDIVFDETVSLDGHPFPEPWPIVSGTGEFLGATGSVESPDDSTWSWGGFVI